MYSTINLINKINYIDSRAACINKAGKYENTCVNSKVVASNEPRVVGSIMVLAAYFRRQTKENIHYVEKNTPLS